MHYLLGAHGTGKSTLVQKFQETNPDYPIMESMARPLHSGLRQCELEIGRKNEQIVLNELSIRLHENTHKVVDSLSTRSLVDQILYNEFVSPELPTEHMEEIWRRDYKYTGYIFYIPIEFPLVSDESRNGIWSDPEIQRHYDLDVKKFLDIEILSGRLKSEQVVTLRGTVEERVEKLSNYLLKQNGETNL